MPDPAYIPHHKTDMTSNSQWTCSTVIQPFSSNLINEWSRTAKVVTTYSFSGSTGGCQPYHSRCSSLCMMSVVGLCCVGTQVVGWRWRPIIKVNKKLKTTEHIETGDHQHQLLPSVQPAANRQAKKPLLSLLRQATSFMKLVCDGVRSSYPSHLTSLKDLLPFQMRIFQPKWGWS